MSLLILFSDMCADNVITALCNSSCISAPSRILHAVSNPNLEFLSSISPSIISGCDIKYLLMFMPSAYSSISTHSGKLSVRISSLFCKNIISVVTSVPAFLKALSGSLIAPPRSALSAKYLLHLLSALSRVPLEVISANIPPGLTLSIFFAKK